MPSGLLFPKNAEPLVEILEEQEDYTFGSIFRVLRAKLRYRLFGGGYSEPVTRINFERGDSVGVLLYDRGKDSVLLVRQFRYPVYAGLKRSEREGEGAEKAWILEVVAGVVEPGLTAEQVANKELLEEAGYRVEGPWHPITTIYPSPGGTSERIFLFWAEMDAHGRVGSGGGLAAEGENTRIEVLPFADAMHMIESGEICDAKTILCLQHLALSKTARAPAQAM